MDTLAKANDKYRATLRSTFVDGVDTTLNVTAIPTNLPTIVTVGWNTQYETVFRITGTSGTNSSNYALTGITKIKGYSGNLPENLAINCLNHEEFFNQYATAVFSLFNLKSLMYAEDGGSSDTYVVALDPAPSEYFAGMLVIFKANTINTGAATLNVNSLGAKAIKKNYNEDLADGDIKANQLVLVVYDGTNFQYLTAIPETVEVPTDGWTAHSITWTRTSDTTFTLSGDYTLIFTKGTRIKWSESGTVKYGTVKTSSHAGGTTTVTLFATTDYVMAANPDASSTYYSYQINPQGYPGTFSFTPTLNEVTLGNGTNTGKFNVIGNRIRVQYKYFHGSTSSITGNPNYALPVTPNPNVSSYWRGIVLLEDSGAGVRHDACDMVGSVLYMRVQNGTTGVANSFNNTTPITFAVNDNWLATMEYDF